MDDTLVSLPNILKPTNIDDSISNDVETYILDNNSFSFVQNGSSVARFEIPKKAVLDGNSVLVFNVTWTNPLAAADKEACLPKMGGGLVCVKNAKLSLGGKTLQSTEQVGEYLYMKDYSFETAESRDHIHDIKLNASSGFSVSRAGKLKFNAEPLRRRTGLTGQGCEIAISLKQLFPVFSDIELPLMYLKGNVLIEIQFETVWTNIFTELLAAGGVIWAAADRVFTITRPRLLLDFINYGQAVLDNLESKFKKGVVMPFRNISLVKKAHDGGSNTFDIGFNNQIVRSIYLQKIGSNNRPSANDLATRGVFQKRLRSDKRGAAETINFNVNNVQLFQQDISKPAELYSYLSQTRPMPFRCLAGTYELEGADATDANNMIESVSSYNLEDLANSQRLQGSSNYFGFNLGAYRSEDDSPQNGVLVSDAPIVCRYVTDANNHAELNFYIENVKQAVARDGDVTISS